MAVQKPALSFALAWFLLAGLFLTGEATGPRCKQKQVRERKPTIETLRWQEACLPLAVIVGGCCGLVWWVLLIIYDVSQKGGQKGLPQISGEAELEEQKTLDHLEEWTEMGIKLDSKPASKVGIKLDSKPASKVGIKLDSKPASKGSVSPQVEFGPCPPSQPQEQGPTTFWAYLEQELERILLAVRRQQTPGQTPMADEQVSTQAVEKPSPVLGDWQSFLAHIKKYPLTTEGQDSLAVDNQQPPPREGPSAQTVDTQRPPPEEGQSFPVQDKQSPPSEESQSSPRRGRKKSPNRTRSRSKKKSTSRSRNRGRRSPSRKRGDSSGRRGGRPCTKYK